MKTGICVATLLFAMMLQGSVPLENCSPSIAEGTPIVWQAPTKKLPKSVWIYQRLPPHPFSTRVVSNAIAIASLQKKGFPQTSTNDFFLMEDKGPRDGGPIPIYFGIMPKTGRIFYNSLQAGTNTVRIPADAISIDRAWGYAAQMGLGPKEIEFKNVTSQFNRDRAFNDLTNQLCGRGVFLSRKLDNILFWGNGDDGENEGFWIEFGSGGQIRGFSFVWPVLQRHRRDQTVSPDVIIRCIRARKTLVVPGKNESTYFERIKALSSVKSLTITNATPYYMEGKFGEQPNEPAEFICPIVELNAIADWGQSNAPVRILAPLTGSDVDRLLRGKEKRR